MAEPFLGQLMCVGFNFAPRGWAVCQGQMMSIAQNNALFALLGTTYGGDGQRTFGLPDLRGRVPVGMGSGPGLPNVAQGQVFGSTMTTITTSNLPAHAHGIPAAQVVGGGGGGGGAPCNPGPATTNDPTGAYPAAVQIAVNDPGGNGVTATALAYTTTPANPPVSMAGGGGGGGGGTVPASSTLPTGSGIPIDNNPPSLGLNWIICTSGIFPSRN